MDNQISVRLNLESLGLWRGETLGQDFMVARGAGQQVLLAYKDTAAYDLYLSEVKGLLISQNGFLHHYL